MLINEEYKKEDYNAYRYEIIFQDWEYEVKAISIEYYSTE
jgi:hypothetical protein